MLKCKDPIETNAGKKVGPLIHLFPTVEDKITVGKIFFVLFYVWAEDELKMSENSFQTSSLNKFGRWTMRKSCRVNKRKKNDYRAL